MKWLFVAYSNYRQKKSLRQTSLYPGPNGYTDTVAITVKLNIKMTKLFRGCN